MIEVINLNRTRDFGKPGDVRCDRESIWGNPFIMYYEEDRDKVCDLHAIYFNVITIPGNIETIRKMLKMGGLNESQINRWIEKTNGYLDISKLFDAKRLACHCAPNRCHCDTIKTKIESLVTPSLEVDKR